MKNQLFVWVITFLCLSLNSCSDEKDDSSKKQLITNAGVTEANQMVRPGDIVHIYGDGFQEGDQVDFEFRWDIGDAMFPEGLLSFVSAEIIERHSNGMSIRMPYRKPESRVEIFLNRANDRMSLGKVQLADGQTPKDFRLYGINNTSNTIETAWADSKENVAGGKTWDITARPDFHSVLNMVYTYGLCGLSNENGVPQPFFLDFCTGEWKSLNYYNYSTLALAIRGNVIAALQMRNNTNRYSLHYISTDLEQSNYATKTRSNMSPIINGFELPDGFNAGQFGDYPGVFMQDDRTLLLSAKTGERKWAPVVYNPQGFFALKEMEADALIPFYFNVRPDGDLASTYKKMTGYVISSSSDKGGSRFCLLSNDVDYTLWEQNMLTELSDKVVAVAHRPDRYGTLTVLTEKGGKYAVSDYDWNSKEWKSNDELLDVPYSSIVWAN